MEDMEKYVPLNDLPTCTGVPRSFLQSLIDECKIPFIKVGAKGYKRFKISVVMAILDEIAEEALLLERPKKKGPTPFGDKPREAKTLARIKKLYRKPHKGDRLSCYKIAKALNRERRTTRSGAQWSANSVKGILERLNILK